MSKKLKALICAVLTGMMVTTSTGLVSLAADEEAPPASGSGADIVEDIKDAENAVEALETAKPAATEAPAEPVKSYDNDIYYQNALKVCAGLGIITGYADGSVKPESTVTRAEMATIVLRMLDNLTTVDYKNVFTDLTADHWAAKNIQTAVEQGILDGMGDGTFLPDGEVKYEQVLKMIVAAMGYTVDATKAGGYPNGYISVASSPLKLLDSVNGVTGQSLERGEVIKVVYNALQAPFRTIARYEGNNPIWETKDSLGVEKFKLYNDKGVLTTTPNITIASGVETKDDVVVIDGTEYRCDFNVDEYVGTKVKFFYIDEKADDPKIIALYSDGRSTEIKADAEDVEEITANTVKIKTSKNSNSTKTYKTANASVIYNGTILNAADYAASGNTEDYYDFIKPTLGTVRLVDYDADDIYDIIFVDKYETFIVNSATSEKVTGKINGVSVTIEYDADDTDQTITVIKSGSNASIKNLKKNDVASLRRNIDETILDFTVTGESVTGKVEMTGIDDETGYQTATINGTEYKLDANVVDDVKNGVSGTFYTDMFNVIGYCPSLSNENDTYAVIANVFDDDTGELVIRLFNQKGEALDLKPAGSVNYWAPGAAEATTANENTLRRDLKDESKLVKIDGKPLKLCKYRVNSSGKITKLYMAVDIATIDEEERRSSDGLLVHGSSMKNNPAAGGAVAGYFINDGIVEFTIPSEADDRSNPANYSTGSVTASSYKNTEDGVNTVFTVGDFTNSKYPQVLVKYATGATSLSAVTDVSTASSAPSFILKKIIPSVDSEGEPIFKLVGYSNGAEVSYMTASNTGIYDFGGWDAGSGEYQALNNKAIFDATSSDPSTLTKIIRPGDIFVVNVSGGNATTLVRMVSVAKLAKTAVDKNEIAVDGDKSTYQWMAPAGASAKGSNTRDKFYIGWAKNVDVEDSAFIDLTSANGTGSGSVVYDSAAVFSNATLKVDSNGNIADVKISEDGGIEPSEIATYDGADDTVFDFCLFKSLKGNMNSGYVITIEIEE